MGFIDIIRRNYTRSYDIQIFFHPDVGVIFEKYILSSCHKLVDADPAGTLDSCYGTKNEQKNTQNTVIEVEIRLFVCTSTESHHMRTLCQGIF